MGITNNMEMSGYKTIPNQKGYTLDSLLQTMKEKNVKFSCGEPEIKDFKGKPMIIFSEKYNGFMIYIKVDPKKIEISRVLEKPKAGGLLLEIGAQLLTNTASKDQSQAERAVEEVYDVLQQIDGGEAEVVNRKSNAVSKKLYMKQKIVAIKDKYSICTENEEPVYYIEGNLVALHYNLQDNNGTTLLELKKKMVSIMPEFSIIKDGKTIGTIRKKIKLLNVEISGECEGKSLVIKGNPVARNFTILLDDVLIGGVDTERLTWGDVYSIDIADESKEHLVVAIAVVCDKIVDASNNN